MSFSSSRFHPLFFSASFITLLFWLPSVIFAQDLSTGLSYYQQKKYQKADSIFADIHTLRGYLFLGKSRYALGQYRKALNALSNIPAGNQPQLYEEAEYTKALVNFQQKEFGKALKELAKVSHNTSDQELKSDAEKLYQSILNYLSANQRTAIMQSKTTDRLKFDLLQSALGKIPYKKARKLYQTFTQRGQNKKWTDRAKEFRPNLTSKAAYQRKFGVPSGRLTPPKGAIYHIGIALPKSKPNQQNYRVVKALYLGALLAADNYNKKHHRTQVDITFVNIGTLPQGMKPAVKHFVTHNYGDALIGPLFSEQVEPMASIAAAFGIPVIAPLANGDLDIGHSFVYQANPSYKVQGEAMADFAVNQLGINNFTIIADKNSPGANEARAFRDEARKLNAVIRHYFVKSMPSKYEFSKYMRYFGSSAIPIKAVYAPLNNPNALVLIDLLLRKLRTVPYHVTVLGGGEWGKHHFGNDDNQNITIYYSEGAKQDHSNTHLIAFKNDYRRKFGSTGNEYSAIGYDTAAFILKTLQKVGNPALLGKTIPHQPEYYGLVRNIFFNGTNVNQAVNIIQASGQ